ncbi:MULTISPECIES: helix-turn-helix domain-containing protein [Paenibacillus]|uniref:helix-turn-helix domain-containing protein n=1 Tax=Paenibacillus TaxID=44249 RepID=UPI0022B8EB68|nr:helix-turn-helix domain-containing protein [Paenibacillus caseinilyticus]MCZ8521111.1 helix-turn-helix domain-containing protein [Paenibacillus caseinilyticus]
MLPQGRHFRKSLILILIITSIPGLITGGAIYWFTAGRIESELVQLHKNQIAKRAEGIEGQFSYLELSLSHLAFDPKLDYTLAQTDFLRNFTVTRDLYKTLLLTQGALPLVDRMELFVEGKVPAHFSPDFNMLQTEEERQAWKPLLKPGVPVYWTRLDDPGQRVPASSLSLVHQVPGSSTTPFGVVLFRLNEARVVEQLRTLTPYEEGEAFLLAEDGSVLASSDTGSQPSPLLEKLRTAVLAQRGAGETSFKLDWNDSTYSVSYGTFDRLGSSWTYVTAAPIHAITAPVVIVSKTIIGLSLAGLLLGCLLAWFASRRIYSPMERLVRLLGGERAPEGSDEFAELEKRWVHLHRESADLQHRLAKQLPQVKEGFLLQLMQGHLSTYPEEELAERLRSFGWQPEGRVFTVICLQLTGMSRLEAQGRFSAEDEGLVTFAAANMIEELACGAFPEAHVMNFHDLTAGLLVSLPEEDAAKESWLPLCGNIIEAVTGILRMNVTAAVSRSTASLRELPDLFEEAKRLLGYRSFGEENQILRAGDVYGEDGQERVPYPFTEEKELLQALRKGRQEEAESALALFMKALTDQAPTEADYQQGVLNLLGSLEHMTLQSGLHPGRLYGHGNRFAQLAELREPEQVERWLRRSILCPYLKEMESRSGSTARRMIEEAIQYIETHYMQDISLDSCADRCGTNVFTLSRSFKSVTGMTFVDYVTQTRLTKAKELLRESERRINEIAEQVGYQHGYFNRIFKKAEGVTPSRYRELSRES